MSFILDALKKSESERQRQSGPALLEMRIARPTRTLPAWAVAVGMLLLASVAVLGWLALHPASAPTAASMAAPAAPVPMMAVPAVAVPPATVPAAVANAPETPTPATVTAVTPVNPADTEPALPADPGTPPAGSAGANLHNYAELSGTVPELRLDMHVYAPDPAGRYAFINMRKVREGDVTPEGVQVRQITREGVVLEYRGAEFLLGR